MKTLARGGLCSLLEGVERGSGEGCGFVAIIPVCSLWTKKHRFVNKCPSMGLFRF